MLAAVIAVTAAQAGGISSVALVESVTQARPLQYHHLDGSRRSSGRRRWTCSPGSKTRRSCRCRWCPVMRTAPCPSPMRKRPIPADPTLSPRLRSSNGAMTTGRQVVDRFRARPGSGTISVSFRGVSHGSPTEQEVGLQAGHASRARFPDQSADGHRAADRRGSSSPPHQPERLLSRQEGHRDQERRVIAGPFRIPGPHPTFAPLRARPSNPMTCRRTPSVRGGACVPH